MRKQYLNVHLNDLVIALIKICLFNKKTKAQYYLLLIYGSSISNGAEMLIEVIKSESFDVSCHHIHGYIDTIQ